MSAGWKDGLKKIGEFYQYRFAFRGKLLTGSTKCANLKDARTWLAAYKSRLARSEMGVLDAPTVGRAFENWLSLKQGFSSTANLTRARRAMVQHVLPVIGAMKADQVRSTDVAQIVQIYLDGKGPHGRPRTADGANVVIAYLRAVFAYLVKENYLAKVPFEITKQRTQVKPRTTLPLNKVQPFLDHIDQNAHLHVRIAVRFMLWCGLRESEALGARWEWMRGSNRYIPGKTKGKEAVSLSLSEDLQALLTDLPRDSDWMLPAKGNVPHTQQFTRSAIERAGDAVGVPGLTPHRLRATYATLLSQTGASVYEVQKLLRHKQLSTTLHYVQVDQDSLTQASSRLYDRVQQLRRPDPIPEPPKPTSDTTARLAQIIPFNPGAWGQGPSPTGASA